MIEGCFIDSIASRCNRTCSQPASSNPAMDDDADDDGREIHYNPTVYLFSIALDVTTEALPESHGAVPVRFDRRMWWWQLFEILSSNRPVHYSSRRRRDGGGRSDVLLLNR